MRAGATAANQHCSVQGGHVIRVIDQRVPARAVGGEYHFVVAEVGLLGDYGNAVGQRPLHGIDRLDPLFRGDGSGSRDCRQQRDIVEGVDVGVYLQGAGRLELCLHHRGQLIVRAGVGPFGTHDQQDRVPELSPGRSHSPTSANETCGSSSWYKRPLGLDAGSRRPAQKVVRVLLGEIGRQSLVSFLVQAFDRAQQVDLLPGQLGVGKPCRRARCISSSRAVNPRSTPPCCTHARNVMTSSGSIHDERPA